MTFKSTSSKHQAQATVNKLFANILPNTNIKTDVAEKQKLSSTQLLSNQFNQASVPQKKIKKKTNAKIKKMTEQDKKFKKFVKYNIIKNHTDRTTEEEKYLKKLVKRNITQINNLSHIDNIEIEEELSDVRADLLQSIGKKENKRLRKRKIVNKNSKFDDFDNKVKRGFISVPGLTPGLAPVDYNESDSE
ncbi:regulator of rDNA transcription 14 [Scheffersomyces xylosifermentans]|uniref:regulator of rDNA transcription 14 n=1 Tax=Scheffersomyces xylosifermentans TaxID=1304137 RepID=UPI00315CBEFE